MKAKEVLRRRMFNASRLQSELCRPAVSPGQRLPKRTHPYKLLLTTVGPALVLAAWDQVAQGQTIDFNYTGAFQSWTVPTTGLYRITAFGAQGGDEGGFGAKISGDFNLTSGQVLSIAVGGAGGNSDYGGGGGGGSFVTRSGKALVIAGGGGATGFTAGLPGGVGGSGSAGGGAGGGAGGSGGSGGSGGGYGGGGGGAGFLGNGGNGGYYGGGGGFGFSAGLAGGTGAIFKGAPGHPGGDGGFGGGGGGGVGSGGGGGYSGGGGGSFSDPFAYPGGGGGSFNAGFNPINVGGFRSGNGLVEIVRVPALSITNSVPGFAILSWAPASTNWVLQENLDLATTNWVNSPSGTNNPVTVSANQAAKFYRLLMQ